MEVHVLVQKTAVPILDSDIDDGVVHVDVASVGRGEPAVDPLT